MGMDPFIGEISIFAGNFAPRGWAFCDGQLLPISSNSALFSILGTTYGGDGRTTFALPDLRGRFPMHPGRGPGLSDRRLGQRGGAEQHTLNQLEMPTHSHTAQLHAEKANADKSNPTGKMLAASGQDSIYADPIPADNIMMAAESIVVANAGGNQPFNMMNPFECVNFIIALQGVFPSRS